MAWLVIFIAAWILWKGLQAERDLREIQELQRRFGTAESWPLPEPPSPHQLLGDVARPVPTQSLRLLRPLSERVAVFRLAIN